MPLKNKLLVVDDQNNIRHSMAIILEAQGYEVDQASSGSQAIDMLNRESYDLVITDLKMGEVGGEKVLTAVKSSNPDTEVIIVTAFGTVESAVESMKQGAFDYITKPFNHDELILKAGRALEHKKQKNEINYLRHEVQEKYRFENILGHSEAMQNVLDLVSKVSRSDATVMIQGESGTGKELIARAIHNNSLRKDNHFVVINCGALPRELLESELFGHRKGAFTGAVTNKSGLIEEADRGTFFLDEVGELDLAIQAKLLRVLEDGSFRRIGENRECRVDVRFLSATNRNLEKEVEEGRFRQDLFYRLNVVNINLPPLRERQKDIPLLANYFLMKYCKKMGKPPKRLPEEVTKKLAAYSWPGNVRELENAIEQAAIFSAGDTIAIDDIPTKIRHASASGAATENNLLENMEKDCILQILEKCHNNKSETAKKLGISETTLWRRLKKYKISDS